MPLLALAALFAIFDAVQIILTGALRGMGLTRVPMLANLVGYWVAGLPLGIVLAFFWRRPPFSGVAGIWTGLTLALILIALALFVYWSRRARLLVVRHERQVPA